MQGSLIVASREVGDLPLSIPTSVALDALFIDHANALPKSMNKIYINVRTLFRNMNGSIETISRRLTKAQDYVDVLGQEMEFILSFVQEKSLGGLEVVFYHATYAGLDRKIPNAELKKANTEIQRAYLETEHKAMDLVLKTYGEQYAIKEFDSKLSAGGDVVLLTHSPIDLLLNDFGTILLLESHTGALKSKFEWNSKLTNGSKLSHIPFNLFTIQVFGDKGTYISPMASKLRKFILDMAEKDNWTAVTTEDKIRFSINKSKDHFAKNFFLKVLRS